MAQSKAVFREERDKYFRKAMVALKKGDYMYAPIYMDIANKIIGLTKSQVDSFNQLAWAMRLSRR
ncbi:hypothetical protein KKE60_09050 [Patescibacteria group bacterium]|nr:hypothetical protein [Patescibacteria group bacterium]